MNFRIIFRSIKMIGLFVLVTAFTYFNMSSPQHTNNQHVVVGHIIRHYEKLLHFESLDINAYPPVSALKFAQIGTAGTYLYQRYFDQLSLDRFELILHILYDHLWNESIAAPSNSTQDHSNFLPILTNLDTTKQKVSEYEASILCDVLYFVELSFTGGQQSLAFDNKMVDHQFKFVSSNPILPKWGNRCTQIITPKNLQVHPPFFRNSSLEDGVFQDALQIFTRSSDLSIEDKWIAEFWSDDVRGLTFSPVGRWFSIANQIIIKENTALKDVLSLYFRLGLALYDSSVICWRAKYYYNLERPSTFIHQHFDTHWQPLHDDPSFPAYPSGHAVFGSVAVGILEHFYGKNYAMTDKSHLNRIEFLGKERSFQNLDQMAKENAYSRIVLGVHFQEDCTEGLRIGKIISNSFNILDDNAILDIMSQPVDEQIDMDVAQHLDAQ